MRELFASLLSGWVAQSRENGQINGYLGCKCNSDRTRLTGSLFLLFFLTAHLFATNFTLQNIEYTGSELVTQETLKNIYTWEPGIYCDSIGIELRNSLEKTDLFEYITIKTDTLSDSLVVIRVKLVDNPKYYISDIGGSLYGKRYGKETDFPWIRGNLGLSIRALNGTGQKLTFIGEGIRIWKAGIRWDVPLKNDFFLTTGTTIGAHPSRFDQWHNRANSVSSVGIGHNFTKNISLFFNTVPEYNSFELIEENSYDEYWEVQNKLIGTINYLDRDFNPHRGLFFEETFQTNALLPYRDSQNNANRHATFISDFRAFYNPGNRKVILGAQLKAETMVYGSYNRYDRLYLGGSETVRGFSEGSFGEEDIFNNRFIGNAEIRFPIHSFKNWNLSFLSWYDRSLKNFSFDIAGVAFVTGGHLLNSLESSTQSISHTVMAAGTGIRFHFPSLDMSGCAELGWPIYAPEEFMDLTPTTHVYVNMPF